MATTAAVTAAGIPAPAAVAPTAAVAGGGTGPRAVRAEVAELVGQLGVERLLEGDADDGLTGGGGSRRLTGLGTVAPLRPVRTGGALAAVGRALRAVAGRRVTGRAQADLALVVDLVDADLDLLTEREDVLDGVDPLAPSQLGDVEQAVTA